MTVPTVPLNLVVVTETWPPEVNGVAHTIKRMVDGLRARGHRINLIRPRQPDDAAGKAQDDEMLTPSCAIPGYSGLRFGLPVFWRVLRFLREVRPDVVQVVTEGPLGWAAVAAAKRCGIPVVSEFHTNFDAYCQHYRLGWLRSLVERHLRSLHNCGVATLVPTRESAMELGARGYVNVQVIARGVDTSRFHPDRRMPALREHWGVEPQTPVVAHVGRLAAEKNLDLLVRTFRRIAQQVPQARLLLVGDGPQRAALLEAMPDAIFAGMRHGDDLASHYASADLFLFPSRTETFGNVTLEALASGLPVIAQRLGAATECIVNGDNGFAAPVGDDETFMRIAVAYAAAPVASANLRGRIAGSVAHLSWQAIIGELEAVLRTSVRHWAPATVSGLSSASILSNP